MYIFIKFFNFYFGIVCNCLGIYCCIGLIRLIKLLLVVVWLLSVCEKWLFENNLILGVLFLFILGKC